CRSGLKNTGPGNYDRCERFLPKLLLTVKKVRRPCSCGDTTRVRVDRKMSKKRLELLQGTLDLMVLQTLADIKRLHGYGIAQRIEQVSGKKMLLNQKTIYASLVRLQQRGWISAK